MPPRIGLDPSQMTDQDLLSYVEGLIVKGYEELPTYILVIPDILTAGIIQFSLEQARARRWSDRILQLLQDVRNVSAHVSRIAKGKDRLFENAQAVWLQSARNGGSLKGLDATERRQLARLGCDAHEQAVEQWQSLEQSCKNYVEHLKDKLKDLENAKQELRSQLWAVRIHGVLGELGDEARDGKIRREPSFTLVPESNSPQSQYTQNNGSIDPPAAHPDDVGPATRTSPEDLDVLLGEIQEERIANA